MASNYNNEILSDGTFHWFQGQIVDDSTWQENVDPKSHITPDKKGWAHRYKVRILGQHGQDKSKLPDENLPTCEVLMPVTAGSGILGSKQTPNLSQGDFVIGFFKDGMARNEPIILGCYSTGEETKLYPGDPAAGFVQRSGYKGKSGDKPLYRKDQVGDTGQPRENSDAPNQAPASNLDQQEDFEKETHLENNCEKKNSEMKGIQLTIKNLLKSVNKAKKAGQTAQKALGAFNAAGGPDFLTNEINASAQLIAQFIKNIMTKIRGYVNLKLTNAVKDVTALIFPNKRQDLQKASEKGVNTFYCVIEKIIDKLIDLIKGLLNDLINNYVNAPLCAAEQFLGNLIGSLMGELTSGIASALAPITAAVGGIAGQIGSGVDKFMNALNIASNILQFFSCDSEQECPEYDAWNFGAGTIQIPSPSAALGKKLDQWTQDIDIPGGNSAPPCNTSGIPCGPPQLQFLGGNGLTQPTGNLVISAAGSILGVDLTGNGSGYTQPPVALVVDQCGIGQGAVLQAVVDPILEGPPLTPVVAGGTGGTPLYVGGTGGTPVTTPDGTPVNGGGSGGTPVVVNPNTTPTTGGTGGGGGTTPTTGGTTGTIPTTGGTTGTTPTTGGTTGTTPTTGATTPQPGQTPLTDVNGNPIVVGGTGGTPVYAGGEGGVPIVMPNNNSVNAGGDGGVPVTTPNGTVVAVSTPAGGVIAVQVVDPGFGYLSTPNGSVGGNDQVFAENTDGIYTSPTGAIDSYPPGSTITVCEGGTLGLPAGTTAEVYDNEGNLVQTIVGTGLLTPTVIDFGNQIYTLYESLTDGNLGNIPSQYPESWLELSSEFEVSAAFPVWDETYAYNDGNVVRYGAASQYGTVTIPTADGMNDMTVIGDSSLLSSGNTYPVTLCLEEVVIDNQGYLYDPSDRVFITPNNGTELSVEYDDFGRVTKVNVIQRGCGFTDIPEIGIISLTGYNASLRPILRVRRVGEDEALPDGVDIISVVDCVGKV